MSYILEALKKSQQEREAITEAAAPVVLPESQVKSGSKTGLIIFGLSASIIVLALFLLLTIQKPAHNFEQIIYTKPVEKTAETPLTEQAIEEQTISPRIVATVDETEQESATEVPVQRTKVEERKLPPLASLRKIPEIGRASGRERV